MLRRWPQTSRLDAQTPRRAFWSQAVDFLARLKGDNVVNSVAANSLPSEDESRSSTDKTWSQWRPQVAVDAEFPSFLQNADADQISHAKKVFSDFALHLRRSPDSAQLLQSWKVIRKCQPVVVEQNGVRLVDEAADSETDVSNVMQMVPADVFAQRVTGSNRRTMFVGSTTLKTGANVTAANEAVVVALLVEYFYALRDHSKTVALFESYNYDRRNWLKNLETGADSSTSVFGGDGTLTNFEGTKPSAEYVRATRLWAPARSAYLKALMAKSRNHKVLQFVRDDKRNLDVACESIMTMSPVLIGCRKGKDSSLARRAIDTMSKRNPGCVLPVVFYELALKAAIQKKNRDEGDLNNALWIARKMNEDAGYILQPDLWFALFNTSLHLKREDCALEIFNMYSENFTSLYQDHFRRALRKACRRNHPDVALNMVRVWLDGVGRVDAETKTKVLGFVLREMLSSGHAVSTITKLLAIMESYRIEAGGMVLKRTVRVLLDDASERLSPPEAIKSSLEFWATHNSAVQNPVFLIYALLQECLAREWLDECELVVKALVERRLSGVPCNSVVKVMDLNEKRGQFEANVRIGEILLKSLTRPGFKSLNQQFFERYLKALLCVGRFDEVREQHARLKLGKRFSKSLPIAVALRDANAQRKLQLLV